MDSWNIKVQNFTNECHRRNAIRISNAGPLLEAFIRGMPSKLALRVAFIEGMPSESALREAFIGEMLSESALREAFIGGMPSESAEQSKSKKVNELEATGSNHSRTLFWKK